MTPAEVEDLIDGTIIKGQTGLIVPSKVRAVMRAILDAAVSVFDTKADIISPAFTGTPTVPTAAPGTNTTQAASTAFVAAAVGAATVGVSSFNGRTGAVTPISGDVTGALGYTPANVASPALTGTPTAPTAADGTSTTQISSTSFVQNAINLLKSTVSGAYDTLAKIETALGLKAPLASPAFTGTPAVPTAAPGTNTTQAASTAFVAAAVTGSVAGVASFNSRTGAVSLSSGDVTTALGYTPANTVSPALTGTPTAPLAADGDATSKLANTTFVQNAIVLIKGGVSSTYDTLQKLATALAAKADLASPTFTGTPSGPTAAGGTNTAQLATTAFTTAAANAAAAGKITSATVNGAASFSAPTDYYIYSISASVVGGVLQLVCAARPDVGAGGGGGGA